MSYVEVENLNKWYSDGDEGTKAVNEVSFSVNKGNIFTVLGPSGCGKTTTLRCLAGLEAINSGRISLDGQVVSDPSRGISLEPDKRDIGLMYQSYALWPHMTVESNITYALDGRDYEGDNDERVSEVLDLVGMPEVRDRYPSELSGGQQQRVAFARALSYEPSLLLMDEPLSNLDLKQRRKMRTKLLEILDTVGITTIYVTHDQEEGFEISDDMLVMNNGQTVQSGPPEELYQRPATSFVADFLGEANIFDANLTDRDPLTCTIGTGLSQLSVRCKRNGTAEWTDPVISIRSEDIDLVDRASDSGLEGANIFSGRLEQKRFRGDVTLYLVDVDGLQFKVQTEKPRYAADQEVTLHVPTDAVSIVEK